MKDLYGVVDEVSVEGRKVKERKHDEYKDWQGVCYKGFMMQRNGIKWSIYEKNN